ncbi:tetratricopeptide repeat protein [Bordetella genomosp. 13]|uniref:tetratricopeptide repeat protein n=1 Tax=Bordetella genomosp. 13 TaxID=463040 RepID=UPI0011A9AA60|nr:tetratricopeptide repeat protein [Bordetella genomosp. 13]
MDSMIDRLKSMLAAGQDNVLLRFTLGKACAEAGSHEEAVAHLRAALAFDAHYSVAWKWLGKALLAQGRRDQAREAWQSGVQAAQTRGDAQVVKELQVFLRRLEREAGQG